MNTEAITRKALYALIWEKSLRKVAQQINVKSQNLKKICVEEDIPTPQAGYWIKIKHGKPEFKPELIGDLEREIILEEIVLKESKFNSESLSLTKPHQLVKEAREALKQAKPRFSYSSPQMVTTGRNQIDITVSPNLIKRSLVFMDNLIKYLEARNHTIGFKRHYGTIITVRNIKFEVSLREKCKRTKETDLIYESYKMVPTGTLIFKTQGYPYREWVSTKNKTLIQKIPDIIGYLEEKADERNRLKIIHKANIKLQEQERLEKERQQNLRIAEIEKFNAFYEDSLRYDKAQQLRKYITVIEQQNKDSGIDDRYAELVHWAKKKADWVDPLIEHVDPILGNYSDYLT
ncbi:hypothetical protein HPE56_15945 [Maribacter sp. ANRC-HE7]|uniref:Uncharacterized protein n=1 Tax=Maribacter aquimaris TaxID=2737171 RepID=A0ABR7V3D7_9FLAO|nr:hypothetical protein [Maribacter aquimaris]MBD0779293.1 hypothetical protein [Maribacter aquimaris]